MNLSDIPLRLPIPFAAGAGGAYTRQIPTASQIGVVDGAASLTDGFPPLNAQPIAAGGIPPDIKDMNGILYEISGWARWVAAGGAIRYDSAFQAAIGGYPFQAVVQSTTILGIFWISRVDGNMSNPDAGGANWSLAIPVEASLSDIVNGTFTDRFISPRGLRSIRASAGEVAAMTDNVKYVTPAGLAAIQPTGSLGIAQLPGGQIMQWGFQPGAHAAGNYSFSFNTPFPNGCSCLVPSVINGPGGSGIDRDIWAQWWTGGTNRSTGGVTLQAARGDSNTSDGFSWIAYGN